jgi:hypothetical protein
VTAASVVKLAPDGRVSWTEEATEALWGYAAGVDAAGEVLVRHGRMTEAGVTVTLEKRRADGGLRWALPRVGETRATLDRAGATVLVGCDDAGRVRLADAPGLGCAEPSGGPTVAKLDADGRLLWTQPVPASRMLAPQVAADGTVFFAGIAGAPGTSFGETVLAGGRHVVGALAATGEPLRATEVSELAQSGPSPELELAVAPTGAVLVAGRAEPPGSDAVLVLVGLDPDGRERFRRTYPEFRIPQSAAYGTDLEPFVSSTDHEHLGSTLAIDFAP